MANNKGQNHDLILAFLTKNDINVSESKVHINKEIISVTELISMWEARNDSVIEPVTGMNFDAIGTKLEEVYDTKGGYSTQKITS